MWIMNNVGMKSMNFVNSVDMFTHSVAMDSSFSE